MPPTTLGQLALHPAYLHSGSTSMLINGTLMPLVLLYTVKPHTGGARVCVCVCVCGVWGCVVWVVCVRVCMGWCVCFGLKATNRFCIYQINALVRLL